MFAKVAALIVTLMLLGTTVAVAAPPARENLDDSSNVALSQTAVPLYFSTTGWSATSADRDTRDLSEF